MDLLVENVFDCPADTVWNEVQKAALLMEIIQPLVRLEPKEPHVLPERWQQAQTVHVDCWLFGIIPIGERSLHFERIDHEAKEIQSRESDPLIEKWDHLIKVEKLSDNKTRYSDQIEIQAGVLTFPVWLWANWFYRHRQRQWRQKVIPRLMHR